MSLICYHLVVAISTKIQIWKQFTTIFRLWQHVRWLLQSVQRYKFESNSQLRAGKEKLDAGCCNQYKDTNLKAIHNQQMNCNCFACVVAISTKIQIWKQFTTDAIGEEWNYELLQSVQRYKFESNSQRWHDARMFDKGCCNQYKDTNLKAIHNNTPGKTYNWVVVAISTKIQIWKQFTTYGLSYDFGEPLLQSVQRYKFESNSQLLSANNQRIIVVAISTKIQIWKQFTTQEKELKCITLLLQSVQRYKFESNSQR